MLVETNESAGASRPGAGLAPRAPVARHGADARVDAPRSGPIGSTIGAVVFAAAVGLYVLTMPHSFVPGDSANYLNLAHNGALTDRGNGVPLYVTLLNAIVRAPLPAALTDGIRANLLTVLLTASGIAAAYAAALRLTRSVVAAAAAASMLSVCGLVWGSSAWIMPHAGMVLLGALFTYLLVGYEERPSRGGALAMGLVCGLGFGILPDALLFAPIAIGGVLAFRTGGARHGDMARVALGIASGLVCNAALIAWHEAWNPTFAIGGRSVLSSTLFYLRGGQETDWLLGNLTIGHALRGFFTLPMEIGADLEFAGAALALFGLYVGLRERTLLHVGLVAVFAILSMWSGVYPGDTRLLHGLGAYPVAALWLANGAHALIRSGQPFVAKVPLLRGRAPLQVLALGGIVAAFLLGNLAAGKILYRDALCATGRWFLAGYCRERVPESVGDLHLRRARAAITQIPEGSLVLGAAWDATDQMKYLIGVRRERPDLGQALDLTKLDPEEFARVAVDAWEAGHPVFLFGEWADVERWSPDHLRHFVAIPRGEMLFELRDPGANSGAVADGHSP